MGQSSSQPVSSTASPSSPAVAEGDDNNNNGKAMGSGVVISPDLEGTSLFSLLYLLLADIVRDFSNQVVQEEWTKFRAGVLNRQHERNLHVTRLSQQREQERQLAHAQRQQRIQAWDAKIDSLNAQFSDVSVALEHDAKALYRKFEEAGSAVGIVGGAKQKNATNAAAVPCLGPRAHWMDCAIKYQVDTRPCDAYLATLERCVQETVVRLARGEHPEGSGGEVGSN